MRKADLLDELRADIGVVSDKLEGEIHKLYEFSIRTLYDKVPEYCFAGIYLADQYRFRCVCHAGYSSLPPVIRFGEGLHSVAAARGGVVREVVGKRTEVYVPFYRGHHLIGEIVVIGEPQDCIDNEDIDLFCELASLFESKGKECNS
ncbi:hypothetical protein GCM10011571_26210 [Marinithermofilum abyssi]|uniref:GAF domain-containing protein n=1 Tax=Marinithermofilum abyssi TaxID=1571185 RepID=A0A8J2VC77_9BACL|nr:hypothetical protein [Marinithermofilum abyssi]GGE22902.1 hypothetical protein GCM10011571_26210 [Marinithermofilum abyssi]